MHLDIDKVDGIKALYNENGATENNICQEKSTRQIVKGSFE